MYRSPGSPAHVRLPVQVLRQRCSGSNLLPICPPLSVLASAASRRSPKLLSHADGVVVVGWRSLIALRPALVKRCCDGFDGKDVSVWRLSWLKVAAARTGYERRQHELAFEKCSSQNQGTGQSGSAKENLWVKCKSCNQMIFHRDFEEQNNTCSTCGRICRWDKGGWPCSLTKQRQKLLR